MPRGTPQIPNAQMLNPPVGKFSRLVIPLEYKGRTLLFDIVGEGIEDLLAQLDVLGIPQNELKMIVEKQIGFSKKQR